MPIGLKFRTQISGYSGVGTRDSKEGWGKKGCDEEACGEDAVFIFLTVKMLSSVCTYV